MALKIRRNVQSTQAITMILEGKINSQTADILDREIQALIGEGIRTLVLDLAAVDYISSAGIGAVIKSKTSLVRSGGDLCMINLQPQIQKAFDIMRLLPAMNVFASVQEMDAYLAKIQKRMVEEGGFSGAD